MSVNASDVEHLDVLIVGAGLSGIGAGHYLQADCPWASYAIFEARDAIGGTWDLFRYPGVRSDSDMYTLGYSFRPWDRDESIADGAAILDYIRETAAVEGIDRHIRFNHRITRADWSTPDARWNITAERTDVDTGTTEEVHLTCGFLFSCSGYYRYDQGYQPDFPGLSDFGGTVVHPQQWPDDLDYADKRVVVIGSGATAVTLIPSMSDEAEHVTMLQRSPTYIMALPAKNPLVNALRKVLPKRFSGPVVKWLNALMTQGSYRLSQRHPSVARKAIRALVKAQLPKGYEVDVHFKPKYDPWDQRLCLVPDGDLFKAIKRGDASVVTDQIETFTADGIRLQSGAELPADVVVTATGLELLFLGGIEASVDGEPLDLPNKLTYKGMMLEDVPNLAIAIGYTNASWTLKCDLTCQYVTRLLDHMHSTGLRQCTPENHDASVTAAPLLGLSSGYVTRSMDKFPKQGSRFPWQVKQSYLADYRALKRSDIRDEAMQFTNPVPADEPAKV
ncbi:flavin-containing monooxygenase [Actinospongicola halichondriae]|uniref:flavin-containing monooxygenase n=1 Tax=Actinospongicola halichondriae TaxID=3236844 RepID=UPI003D3DA28F